MFSVLSAHSELAVILGGPFSGKTTLVDTWLATDPCPEMVPVVVPEPAHDVAPETYWATVASSLCNSLGLDEPVATEGSFDAMCSVLVRHARPVMFVLDGVRSVEAIEDRVGQLLQIGQQVRVVVTSRAAGSWAEHVDGHPRRTIVGADDLAFSVDETAALCRLFGLARDERTIEWITRRTEGFAAFVAAVCATLRAEKPHRAHGADALDVLVDSAVDLVVMHVVAADPSLALSSRSVLVSAAPNMVTESSISALPHIDDGEAFLSALAESGLIEACSTDEDSADGEPAWCYPEVVRRSLLRVGGAEYPEELWDARSALIDYWLQRSRPDIALEHAVERRDWRCAIDIVEKNWVALYGSGSLRALGIVLLELLPDDMATDDRTVASLRTITRARNESEEPGEWSFPQSFETVLRLGSLRMQGAYDEAMEVCDGLATEPVPDFETLDSTTRHAHGLKYLNFGTVYLLGGRTTDAGTMLRHAHTAGRGVFVEREAAGKLALLEALRGRTHEATRWIEEERRHPPILGEAEALVRTAGLAATALVALDRLDTGTAFRALSELGTPRHTEELWAAVMYVRGRLALLSGVPADGLLYIDSELQHFSHRLTGISAVLVDAARADLHLALGEARAARELLDGSTHPLTAPARARLRLLGGDPGGAEVIVHRGDAAREHCPAVGAELALIGSVAALRLGRRTDARRHLQRAVVLAEHAGVTRPFVGVPPSAVRDILSLGVELPIDLDSAMAEYGIFREIRVVVRLTPRERAVLDALLAGGTASTIAKEQFVTLNTVKTQLRSLYRKLGVHSREEAIAQAQRLVVG
ncbi:MULTISPECIES: LuxR C-terminal-related transcriptional regulator [Rhodococcus]|uniref:LuxR C-terminal-related transcriptional regulator n=1 Tax=Rhodococcus TaxID=1827 RepID=UPI001E3F0846|nr:MULTISPECIES: LuxR C-terminal-related transcriptional regulator [Rhodococcus]MCR8694773.1 LuxR C-terminal-related transcriptional regulator [Rhodococcus pyridinivorans]